jgi:AraC family transcriptional regulator, transcriptional activator of pobA
MSKQTKEKIADLITPNDMGKFVTHTNAYDVNLPILHAKFKVNRIETFSSVMKFPLPPHRKPVFDFIFLTNGTATRGKGVDIYELKAHTFCFLPAYQILTNESMSADVRGFYCHFDAEIFKQKYFQKDILQAFSFLQYNGNPIVEIPETLTPSVINLLERLEYEYETGGKSGWDLICTYLLALFFEVKPFVKTNEKNATDAAAILTKRYKDALAQNIYEKNKVIDYAQLLSVSIGYLDKCVKLTTGRTPHDLLDDVVLLEAQVLLKQTDMLINEIAYKIGKQDPSDFGRFFKSKTGMTPKEYKKE